MSGDILVSQFGGRDDILSSEPSREQRSRMLHIHLTGLSLWPSDSSAFFANVRL